MNALDEYGTGHNTPRNVVVDDIAKDRTLGLVKCDAIPSNNLTIPVLPGNSTGKLLFRNNSMTGTWTSVELRKALEMGHKITRIHSAVEHKRCQGLMKVYVEYFFRMNICNSKPK